MRADSPLEDRVRRRLAALRGAGLLRTLRAPTGVDLSSNDYLNLSTDPRVTARLIEAVRREGCGSTGSRLLRGERDCFEAIERRFAAFKPADRALYFSTGYLANLAVLTTLPEEGDVVFSDQANHASIIDGVRLSRARGVVFPHGDAGSLRELLGSHEGGVKFVVVESLFSMDGDAAPLSDYAAACRDLNAVLIVDEAHAVGVCGQRGSGLMETADLAGTVCVSVNTAGKALGVGGAFVAGPAWAIEYLVQRARPFVFSTAPPPALADALDASLAIVESEPGRRQRLHDRARFLRTRLAAAGIRVPAGSSQIVPILIGGNEAAVSVAGVLQREGFDVRAIRPPTVPPGTARLRVSVNAALSEEVLDRFVDVLATTLREVGLCSAASS
jgi:8-amino-7-oxononanoate synthase